MEEYQITRNIINAAEEVHHYLGPNRLESNYETCLAYELRKMGFEVKQQVGYPLQYKGVYLESGYRVTLIVEDTIVVEIRSVESIYDIHKVKLLTCMKQTNHKHGIILNFNVSSMTDGVKKITRTT